MRWSCENTVHTFLFGLRGPSILWYFLVLNNFPLNVTIFEYNFLFFELSYLISFRYFFFPDMKRKITSGACQAIIVAGFSLWDSDLSVHEFRVLSSHAKASWHIDSDGIFSLCLPEE